MVASSHKVAGLQTVHLMARTQKLERVYEDALQATVATQEMESQRRLRVKIVLLASENEELQDRVTSRDTTIETLQSESDNLTEQLLVLQRTVDATREELRIRKREVDALQGERDGLRDQNVDSSKVLAEKLALGRELSVLRPEVEHLRSQLTSTQNAISEKQSLQRQLRAVEVELENERRAANKANAHGERGAGEDKKHHDALKKALAQREQMLEEARTEAERMEQQNTKLQSRLEAFRAKLTSSKEELSEARKQVKELEAQNMTSHVEEPAPNKKRSLADAQLDGAIGTPGDLPAAKRGKRGVAQPGNKSSFSITPFLNRAGNIPAESPASSPSRPRPVQHMNITTKVPITASPGAKTKSAARPRSLGNVTTGRTNVQPPSKRPAAKSLSAPKLDQVLEEDDENTAVNSRESEEPSAPIPAVAKPLGKVVPTKPKQQKFLGKTIFDDDDEVFPRPKAMGVLSGKPFIGSLSSGGVSNPFQAGAKLGKPLATFGSFSPLKKDRKLSAM